MEAVTHNNRHFVTLGSFFSKRDRDAIILRNEVSNLRINYANKSFPAHIGTLMLANDLASIVKRNMSVLDVGTGAGIFAILSAKLGANVTATDVDKTSIFNAYENAIQNKVKLRLLEGKLLDPLDSNEHFDVIVFNLPSAPTQKSIMNDHIFSGGQDGRYYIDKMLDGRLKNVLKNQSTVITVQSNLSNIEKTINLFRENGAEVTIGTELFRPLGVRSLSQIDHIKNYLPKNCQPVKKNGKNYYRLATIIATFKS